MQYVPNQLGDQIMPGGYKPPPYKAPSIKVEEYQLSEKYPPTKGDSYPFPPEENLWIHSHNAIRSEIHNFQEALEALVERLKASPDDAKLEEWLVNCIHVVWDAHFQYLEAHHIHEEETVGNVAKLRFRWPEHVTNTHQDIEDLLHKIDQEVKNLKQFVPQQQQASSTMEKEPLDAVQALLGTWTRYREVCMEHLEFEEENLIPLVRAYLSHGDMTRLVFKILMNIPKSELGAIIHYSGEEHIRNVSLPYQSIPDWLWPFFFLPAVKNYRCTVVASMEAIYSGVMPPEPEEKQETICFKLCQCIRYPFFALAQLVHRNVASTKED